MVEWLKNFIETYEYIAIFFLMLIENIFPPIPSEVILPLSGAISYQKELNPLLALLSATIGSVAGVVFWYYVGLFLRRYKIEKFFKKYGIWISITYEEYIKSMNFFHRHSGKAVFLARMTPTFRTLISVPAGMVEMPFIKFLVWTSLGTAIWSAILFYLGYAFGSEYEQHMGVINIIGNASIALIVALYVIKVIKYQFFDKHRSIENIESKK